MKSLLFILILFSFLSCDEQTKNTSPNPTPKENSATKSKTFKLGTYKLSASESAHRNEVAPKPETFTTCIKEGLLKSKYFGEEGEVVNLRITYDVLSESSTTSIVLLGEIKSTLFDPISTGLKSDINAENSAQKGEELCQKMVNKLSNNLRVSVAKESELIAMLSDDKSSSDVKKRAIQYIREKDMKAAAPELVKLLKKDDAKLAVAASAALAKFKYLEARGDMLALGEKLSREKNASFIPMLYILADIGGPEIEEYLSTVASSHVVPKVREIAKKALKNLSRKKQN